MVVTSVRDCPALAKGMMMIGYELAHKKTVKGIKGKRLGSLRACLAIDSCDIGIANLESGERVYCTWGRNLNAGQQEYYAERTAFKPIWLGADDGSSELIMPTDMAEALMQENIFIKG